MVSETVGRETNRGRNNKCCLTKGNLIYNRLIKNKLICFKLLEKSCMFYQLHCT